QQQYKISVLAHNSYGDSNKVSLTIKVNNTIDTPPTTYPVTLSIDENSAIGTIVGSVNAIQGEAPIEKYNLTGSGTIPFEIDSSGSVLLKGAIDYEQTRFYTFQYEADNSIGVSNGSAITVTVNDVPDVPATLRPFSLTRNYHEFTVGQSIGNILVSRGDSEITEIMLSPQSPFAVDNQGSMTLQSAFDGNQTSFSLTAKAISPAGESQPTSVTVNILAEPILAETTLRVDENADEGTVAGSIAITSEGMQPIDSFRFNGTVPFVIDANGTVRVAAGADIDFETQNIYTFDITASNQFGESNLVKLTINVNDLPETPLVLQDINLTLSMGTKEGTVVGNVIKESGDMPIKEFIVSGSDLFDVKTNGDLYLKSAFYESNATDSNLTVYARTDYTDSNIATVQVKVVGGIIGRVDTSGYARDIVLSKDETAAYVADSEAGMQIIDITDPVSPQTIATVDTNDSVVSIALSSDERYAYVADGYGGIKIIDLENLNIVGALRTVDFADDIVRSSKGSHLFVADGYGGIQIIDISNPYNPENIGNIKMQDYTSKIAISEDDTLLYIAGGSSGLHIFDITDPKDPRPVSSLKPSGRYISDVGILSEGKHLWISDSFKMGIVDIENPKKPYAVGISNINVSHVAFKRDMAVVVENDMKLVDIRNLASLTQTETISTPGYAGAVAHSKDKSLAYIADGYSGFEVVGLKFSQLQKKKPAIYAKPICVAEDTPVGTQIGKVNIMYEGENGISLMLLQGEGDNYFSMDMEGKIYLQKSLSTSPWSTFDLTLLAVNEAGTIQVPVSITSITIPIVEDFSATINSMASPGTLVSILDMGIDDETTVTQIDLSGEGSENFTVNAKGEIRIGDTAQLHYFEKSDYSLHVVATNRFGDSQPANVQISVSPIVSSIGSFPNARDIVLSSDESIAYCLDLQKGLQIIALDDIRSPKILSILKFDSGSTASMVVSSDGAKAFIADSSYLDSGIWFVDLTDKTAPIASFQNMDIGYTEDMVLSADNTKLFLANGREGFKVIDVSNTSNMKVLGSLSLPNNARRIALSGDEKTAFVANEGNGMVILDVSDVASPVLLFTYGVSFSTWDLSYGTNNLVLLSDAYNSIHAVDVSSPNVPQTISTFWFDSSTSDITIAENGEFAIFGSGYDGIYLLDIRDLYAISSTYVIGSDSWNIANAFSLDTSKAFVLDYDGFRILDLTGF
ncbi:MAG: hypothetical protein ABXS92_07705, partial [Sulfurimonas sp.]